MVSVGVIGSGAWGTTLARMLASKGMSTTLWEHHAGRAVSMQEERENRLFLPDFCFPANLRVTADIAQATRGQDLLLLVTPSQSLRANLRLLLPALEEKTLLVSASKGIEVDTLRRMSEVVCEELPDARNRLAVLSGPNLSREVASEMPTAAVVASYAPQVALRVRSMLTTAHFRVYNSDDVAGVELGGALKNIIAIGDGFSDGMGYGENAKAAFMTRGLAEISRLGIAAGANPLTFSGLAGIGDLIATCASPLSRNQRLGKRLAAGEKLEDILASTHSVAEGAYTTRAALRLAEHYRVDIPITQALGMILFENLDPYKVVPELMMRDPKHELQGIREDI